MIQEQTLAAEMRDKAEKELSETKSKLEKMIQEQTLAAEMRDKAEKELSETKSK